MAFRTRAEIRRSTFKTARSIGANFRDEKFKILRTAPGYNLQHLKIHEYLDIPMKKHNKSVTTSWLNPQAPVTQKTVDEVIFRRFQGEGVEFFFNRTSLTPSDFWCASFGKYRFKPFQISFFIGFYIKIIFWVRWFYSLFERMRLKRKKWCSFTLTNL